MMVKWNGSRYRLPGDPDPLTEAFWRLEDWWRYLGWEERAFLGVVIFAMALMTYTLLFGR